MSFIDTQQICIIISEMNSNSWLLSGIYVSTNYKEWRVIWHEICTLLGQDISTLVVGDFNCIESSQKKWGARAFVDRVDSMKFRGFIKRNRLVDLGFVGP